MKYTIEEIESMRDLKLKFHEDYGDDFTVEWEIITDLVEELKAIGEIVLKLNFSIAKEAYFKQEILDRTLLQRDKRLTEENKRLREALKKMSPNKYSSEEEMLDAILGTQVTASHVISPIDLISADSSPIKTNIEKSVRIKISREALGLNKQPGKTYNEHD